MSRFPHLIAPAALIVLVASAAATAADPPLGRLFLTPEARQQLERQRQLDLMAADRDTGGTLRLDGIVTRSDGKTLVWLNGRAQAANMRGTAIAVAVAREHPARATLRIDADAPVKLKVGETHDRATRTTVGGLVGEIRVPRAPIK